MSAPPKRPGEELLDLYFAGAEEETRERAYQRFWTLAGIVARIVIRKTVEEIAEADSPNGEGAL